MFNVTKRRSRMKQFPIFIKANHMYIRAYLPGPTKGRLQSSVLYAYNVSIFLDSGRSKHQSNSIDITLELLHVMQ